MRLGNRAGREYVRADSLSSPPRTEDQRSKSLPLRSHKPLWLATGPPCVRAATNRSQGASTYWQQSARCLTHADNASTSRAQDTGIRDLSDNITRTSRVTCTKPSTSQFSRAPLECRMRWGSGITRSPGPGRNPRRIPPETPARAAAWVVLCTPVAKVDDARAERPCLEQLEVDLLRKGREVSGAAAQHDRADEQPVLVDEVQLDQRGGEARAAGGHHVLPRPFLEPGDLAGNIVRGQPGVARDLRQCRGEHDLRDGLPDPGELELEGVGPGLLSGLPGQHVLVQPPPTQVRADLPRLLNVEPHQLLDRKST